MTDRLVRAGRLPRATDKTWVIGAGGLLGHSVTASLAAHNPDAVMATQIRWSTRYARADLSRGLDRLSDAVLLDRRPWRIAWCAGAGVIGTSASDLDAEVLLLVAFLDELATRSGRLGPGTLFLASSAGGLYAGGAGGGPYTEVHPPAPISDYGRAKLSCELAVREYALRTGNSALVGRIANLYGPGQNLAKGQGLISQMCRAHIARQPISVYVSLDTIRDYLYVDDCAAMIRDLLDGRPPVQAVGQTVTKVLASQQGTTIASLIAICRKVFKRAPRLVLGSSANTKFQVKDLRLRSVVWPEIDRRALTTLPAGIEATLAGALRVAQRGG